MRGGSDDPLRVYGMYAVGLVSQQQYLRIVPECIR